MKCPEVIIHAHSNVYCRNIYTLCLMIVAGLSLIGKHAAQFKEYLAKDHEVNNFCVIFISWVCKYCICTYHIVAVHVQDSSGVESTQQ